MHMLYYSFWQYNLLLWLAKLVLSNMLEVNVAFVGQEVPCIANCNYCGYLKNELTQVKVEHIQIGTVLEYPRPTRVPQS